MKKKMSLFSKIYIFAVAFFLMLLMAASVFLWTVLEAYESVQPKYIAEQVFSEYFESKDAEKLLPFVDSGNGFESEDIILQAIKLKLNNGELDYFSITSDDDGSEKYAVTSGGERIAYFTITKTGEAQKYGFRGYEQQEIEFFMPSTLSATVTVPQGYSLRMNGIEVNKDRIAVTDIPYKANEYLPATEKGKFYDKYMVDEFYFEPEITVLDDKGKAVEVKNDSESGEFFVDFQYDDELREKYTDRVVKIATVYTKVMSTDAEKNELYPYLDTKSDFYKKVKKSDTSWFWPHDYDLIKFPVASEFIKYSDAMFSCRVTLTQELYLGKKTEIVNVDLMLYMKKVDGAYLVYNAVTNG